MTERLTKNNIEVGMQLTPLKRAASASITAINEVNGKPITTVEGAYPDAAGEPVTYKLKLNLNMLNAWFRKAE